MPHRNGTGVELLTDPLRRRVIALIALRPRRSSIVARELGVSRPVASRHLRILVEAGLIVGHRMQIDGRATLYTLNPRRTGAILAWLAGTEVGGPFGAVGSSPTNRESE